jgi:hypothetical protein
MFRSFIVDIIGSLMIAGIIRESGLKVLYFFTAGP